MAAQAKKDVLLVGLGAVGAIYSFILTRSGLATVTSVARSNYDAVNEHGIHFRSQKYGDISGWKPHRLCSSVSNAADRPYSYVVVTTKAIPELFKTSGLLAPLLESAYTQKFPQPTYVLMQNGLNVEVDLYKALKTLGKGEPRIISAAVWIATNLLQRNIVEHSNFDRVALGVYRYNDIATTLNTPAEAALLADFGGILEAGGSTVQVVTEIQRAKFKKNCWNVAFSSLSTLTGYPLSAIFRHPPTGPTPKYSPYVSPTTADLVATETMPAVHAILRELLRLGRAMGFPESDLPSSVVEGTVESTAKMHCPPDSFHRTSMLLDSEQDRPIEVEVILGEVVRMARKYNVEVPRIEMLYALLVVVQNQILRRKEAGLSPTQHLQRL